MVEVYETIKKNAHNGTLKCTIVLEIVRCLLYDLIKGGKKTMAVVNISTLRKNLFNSIDTVIEYNDSITVNTKKGNAVIISESEYNALLETLYLMSQKGLVKRIKDGEREDISKMSTYNPNEMW